MARNLASLAALAILLGGCISVHETQRVCDYPVGAPCAATVGVKGPARVLRHVVLFQFKDGTSAAEIRKIENAFSALPSKISQIYRFEWGTDVSTENLHKGFTHCFVVSFQSEADRDAYATHPAHVEFADSLKPILADVMVVDYWAD
ncbi:MAG TPA: Dabb family protein [Sedimentisphaerales bacterium]|nr:Dabb family protein [Sedimentisphaerales bacterium]